MDLMGLMDLMSLMDFMDLISAFHMDYGLDLDYDLNPSGPTGHTVYVDNNTLNRFSSWCDIWKWTKSVK